MTKRGFRLSPLQRQLWEQVRHAPDFSAQVSILLEGPLDRDALRCAVQRTVKRHEILRTTFHQRVGLKFPVQVIDETSQYSWAEADVRNLAAAIERALEEHRNKPLDYEKGPPVDCLLLLLKPERHLLSMRLPALCADALTLINLVREIGAFISSTEASLPDEDVTQYLQFSEWQNELLEDEESKPGLEYWQQRTESISQPPKLPFVQEANDGRAFELSLLDIEIEPEIVKQIEIASAAAGTTIDLFLLTCWQLLLRRLAGQEGIDVACVLDGRRLEELQDALGLFARAVPLHVRLDDDQSFFDALLLTGRTVADSYKWIDYFLSPSGNGSPGGNNLLSAAFEHQEWPTPLAAGTVSISLYSQYVCPEHVQLKLLCLLEADSLVAQIQYDRNAVHRDDVHCLAERLRALLRRTSHNPQASINSLWLLTNDERRQLLAFNDTATNWATDTTVHQLFEEQVRNTPDSTALVFENQELSYAELNARANRLARYLQTLGVGAEILVCLLLERSVEMVISLLATLKAGAAYVPLEPTFPKQRLSLLLEEIGAPVVITQERFAANLDEQQAALLFIDRDWDKLTGADNDLMSRADAKNLAYVLFTSGSTGKPKGVMVEHRQLVNYVRSIVRKLGLPVGTRFAMVSTFAADLGNTVLFASLCSGGCLHLLSRETASDPEAFADYFSNYKIECLKIVPSHFSSLLAASRSGDVIPRATLVLGGEASNWSLIDNILELSPECRILNHYGPTETTVGAMTHEHDRDSHHRRGAGMPLGEPLSNTHVYLLDQNLNQVETWIPAELCIGGAGLARGYLNHPELTAEKFIPDHMSVEPGARSYRTGDRVRLLSDRSIEFLGRMDHQVKLRGFRIELSEIESVIRHHKAVREAVVELRQDRPGEQRLAAYIVPHSGAQFSAAELYSFLKERLPDYMVPANFVRLESLPLTANGKVDRRALPAPNNMKSGERPGGISPSGLGEELLADLWREVLGVRELGTHDNFFQLGGDSLLAIQLVSRVRKAFQIEMPVQSLFNAPTISEFAVEVERTMLRGTEGQLSKIVSVPRDTDLPLSFAQEQLWSVYKLDPLNTAYNNTTYRRLKGPLDIASMERALNELIRRHEILRTIFTSVDGRPRQVITPPAALDLRRFNLESLPESERVREVQCYVEAESSTPFDLECGPLLRVCLLRLDEQTHIFLLTMHHIITDGWSFAIFTSEMISLYDAFRHVLRSQLRELPIQYADYAYWQRQWLQGEVLDQLTSYWTRQLKNAPEVINLYTDYPRPSQQSFRGDSTAFSRPPELLAALKKLGAAEGVTLFMTLLGAFYVLLHHYSDDEDIVVGTDVANRNRIEVEGLIGFFVNNLALRADLSGNPTFRELLGRVRTIALGAYTHQSLPFASLVKALRVKRSLSHTPVFQILCVLQNTPQSEATLSDLQVSFVDSEVKTSKFDLALSITETETDLFEVWTYRTDLFKPETISRMGADFQSLLENAVQQPDISLSKLKTLSRIERKRMHPDETSFERVMAKGFKRGGHRLVSFSETELIRTRYLKSGEMLPLVLEPNVQDIDLVSWAAANQDYIETELYKHGALLFRGFNMHSIPEFERFAQAASRKIFGDYGDLPREQESELVYQSTPYPSDKAILFHNESSHLTHWPMKQFFHCVEPAERGGETPIVDCRRIYAALPPKMVEQFERKQLMYVRNFTEGLDVNWRDFFRTEDPEEVKAYCCEASMEFEWKGDGLRTRQRRAAVARHPTTGEAVFFNQIQLHHVSCLDPKVREALFSVFAPDELPRNVYYGDGAPIEDYVVQTLMDIYWQNAVSFLWQKGDILMLDNMLVAHARLPYTGTRKIVVAMGDMLTHENF